MVRCEERNKMATRSGANAINEHKRAVLSLYRSILRTHKKRLPYEMRMVGDAYVKEEFRLHRNATPHHAAQFLGTWKDYLVTLRSQRDIGADLSEEHVQSLSAEQKEQLRKLEENARHTAT
ncbi:acetate non-utilizing protein 9 [Balamuthia mandrillaris]